MLVRPTTLGSLLVHAVVMALLVAGPSFRRRAALPRDALIVDIVGALPGAVAAAAPARPAVPPVRLPAPKPEARAVEPKVKPPAPKPPAPAAPSAESRDREAGLPEPSSAPPGPAAPGSGTTAAAVAGGVTALDAADVEFAWYRAQVTAALRSRWVRPVLEDAARPIAATVVFEIRRDGSVGDVRIEAPSGVPIMDRSILRAVAEAAPLPALPSGWREPVLLARYEFVWRPDEPR
jgi:TonB family protein